MAFINTEFLQRAKLTLFFEKIGKTDDGKPKIRLQPMAKVTPYDAATGYIHGTEYMVPIRIPIVGGAVFDEWAEIALEEGGDQHPGVQFKGTSLSNDQQVLHQGPKT